MSFIKKLFGKKDIHTEDKKVNIKDHRSPIEIIEDQLDARLPERFKKMISGEDKTLKVELLDGPYKLLDSLFAREVKNQDENVINVSNDLNSSSYPEENEYVKIPFARSTDGDGYKYLYFVAAKGTEASERVFLRDIDSSTSGRIPLCKQLNFIFRKTGVSNNQRLITNTTLTFSEANGWMEIPDFINIWQDSYAASIREKHDENKCNVDLYLTNYILEDTNENFSKIEVQIDLLYNNRKVNATMAFEIDKAGLQRQFSDNINYRIFYHKLVCVIGTLATLSADLKSNHGFDIEEYLNTLDLRSLVVQAFKEINEENM